MDRRGLGRDEKKTTTDSFVIFEDMPVSPATEKLIGQFKLCAWNGTKNLAINCHFNCTRAALARYKLCFNPSKTLLLHDKINNKTLKEALGCMG